MAEINGANASDDFENVRPQTARIGKILTNTGIGVLRYSLVAILLYYGSFKFHPVEAKAIQPLVANSPFMSWMYSVFSLQAVSNIVGAAEIIFAVLIALRFVSSRLSAIGSLGAIVMTLTTLTFLFTTPGAWSSVPGFPLPVATPTGAFLLKDVFLLGAAIVTAGEAFENHRLWRRSDAL
ncbi:MAG: DUF417 family protein [Acidobacteriota bacterium]|nr:DUF417 family protein [Acidobacteriota bacterium]